MRHSGLTSLPLPSGRNVSGMSAGESKSGQGKGNLLRRKRIHEGFPTRVSWDSVGLTWITSRPFPPTFYRYLAGRSLCERADRWVLPRGDPLHKMNHCHGQRWQPLTIPPSGRQQLSNSHHMELRTRHHFGGVCVPSGQHVCKRVPFRSAQRG